MNELIGQLPVSGEAEYLLDTCFIIDCFSRDHVKKLESFCQRYRVGVTSFNADELVSIHHNFPGQMNHHLRAFLKKRMISLIPCDVRPGEVEKEIALVNSINPHILSVISDHSDAVLFAMAVKIGAAILTKDKHHIFNAVVENFSDRYGIKVLKELP